MSVITLNACCDRCACVEYHESNFNDYGSFKIDKIDVQDWNHGREILCGKHFERMPNPLRSMSFPISAISEVAIGDSIYKEKGTYTYILVKKDSSYALLLDCDTIPHPIPYTRANVSPAIRWGLEQIVLIKAWKNGDTVNMKEIIR